MVESRAGANIYKKTTEQVASTKVYCIRCLVGASRLLMDGLEIVLKKTASQLTVQTCLHYKVVQA